MDGRIVDMTGEVSCGLAYVEDSVPGIRRRRCAAGFSYYRPDGRRVSDAGQLNRIAALAIPPAYSDVWICPFANGHLQATGRDSRGRKQYRYHAQWRRARELDKFERVAAFGAALPRIRRGVQRDLALEARGTLPRAAVLAAVVRLLDVTLARVGNEEYARSNGSFGLTTLRRRHAQTNGTQLRLRFRGKSGVLHEVELEDPKVVGVVQRCEALEGRELFQYEDEEGMTRAVDSAEVNAYLRDLAGAEISAKDFRTWHASVLALALLRRAPDASAVQILRDVAKALRNTVAVCRKSYVHPRVLRMCEAASAWAPRAVEKQRGLSADECALLSLLSRPEKVGA